VFYIEDISNELIKFYDRRNTRD